MNAPLHGRYCDGESLRSREVDVELLPDAMLHVIAPDLDLSLPLAAAIIPDRLGRIPRFFRFSSGAVLELPDSDELDRWLAASRPRHALSASLHWLESRAAVAATATVLLVAAAVFALWAGLPRLARRVAFAVPVAIEQKAGGAAWSVFARSFAQSSLTLQEQQRVRAQLDRVTAQLRPHLAPQLVFVSMDTPNAFALPGGYVIVTDELVRLITDPDQLAAVLAHEIGHVERRHGLQSVLRNSGALLVVAALTGDLSTLGTFSGTLPFILLQYGYAREFEREADAFAADTLRALHVDPARLADALDQLEKSRPKGSSDFSYLSTHPPTDERRRALRGPASAKKPQ